MLNWKNVLEYILPPTAITELMFQLEKSDHSVSLNAESGSISNPALCLCKVKAQGYI